MSNKHILSTRFLNLIITNEKPFRWMRYYTGPHHIQVNVYKTSEQMLLRFNCCCVITIFPEGTFPTFSQIIFLALWAVILCSEWLQHCVMPAQHLYWDIGRCYTASGYTLTLVRYSDNRMLSILIGEMHFQKKKVVQGLYKPRLGIMTIKKPLTHLRVKGLISFSNEWCRDQESNQGHTDFQSVSPEFHNTSSICNLLNIQGINFPY